MLRIVPMLYPRNICFLATPPAAIYQINYQLVTKSTTYTVSFFAVGGLPFENIHIESYFIFFYLPFAKNGDTFRLGGRGTSVVQLCAD